MLRRNIAFLLMIHPELDQSPEFHWMSESQDEHRHYGHDGGVKGVKWTVQGGGASYMNFWSFSFEVVSAMTSSIYWPWTKYEVDDRTPRT